MKNNEIIVEISELLELDENFHANETPIEFDSLSSLGLVSFLDTNFNINITKEEIEEFNFVNDVVEFINERKS